jgi:hypothetical protein
MALPGERQPAQPGQRQRQHADRFEEQAAGGVQRQLLAQQAVDAEGAGQHQRDPGQAAGAGGLDADTDRGAQHGEPLQLAHALLEHQHAERDVEQRQDEIAEAGFDDVAVVDAPDEGQPVGQHQRRGQCDTRQLQRLPREAPGVVEAAAVGEQGGHQQHGPDHAVGDYLGRRYFGDLLEEDRHHAPDDVGADAGEDACPGVLRRDGGMAHSPGPVPRGRV